MDYVLIIMLQFLGVCYRVGETIAQLKKTYPTETKGKIFDIFFKEDWNTLFMSAVVLATDLIFHYIVSKFSINWEIIIWQPWGVVDITIGTLYGILSYLIAIVLGYKGQDLIYKWLGTAATRLDKEVTDKIQ